MAYQVLARKWRPQTFAEVVGQEHISRTLKNAIIQNRIGHAYLFVGSRGIGKTTSARIFAKALNCSNNVDGEPCCQCESCREIAAGTSLDVIEIDGASHNKVEDIRDIRDNVQYMPVHGRFKIYIIDEVHMLTTQAWNALLKTLEEPPEHVKFLFATTEPHKVLPTIISRCQRFDLKRISVPLIAHRLRQIADGEHIHVEENALAAIARAADGGMRDAQSIFDQMIAFCGGLNDGEIIREQDVIDVFGLASGMELREMAAGIFGNDINRAMAILQKLADSGRDLERLFGDLVNYIRNIMVAGVTNDPSKFLEVSDTELAELVALGKNLDPRIVQQVLQGLVAQEWNFRSALNKRIYFESVLARVILDVHSVKLDDILRQLNVLNGTMPQLQTPVARPNPFGAAPPSTEGAVACPKAEPAPAAPAAQAPVIPPPAAPAPMTAPTPAAAIPQPPAPAPVIPQPPAPAPVIPQPPAPAPAIPPPAAPAPMTAPAPVIPQPAAPTLMMAPAPAMPQSPAPAPMTAPAPVIPQPAAPAPAMPQPAAPTPMTAPAPAPVADPTPVPAPSPVVEPAPVPMPAPAPAQAPAEPVMPAPVSEAPAQPCVQDAPPDDFYNHLEPPPDMDDLDANTRTDWAAALDQVQTTLSPAEEDEHKGMRRPTLDEFEKLNQDPFVQRVKNVFHTSIVDARLKN